MTTYSSNPFFFFFNDTAPTEFYPFPLHDALPICHGAGRGLGMRAGDDERGSGQEAKQHVGRRRRMRRCTAPAVLPKATREHRESQTLAPQRAERSESTRLNSSHLVISYAVFCLKK